MNITDLIKVMEDKAKNGSWIPACGGTDLILSQDEAENALALF
jgi:hypothetical protein